MSRDDQSKLFKSSQADAATARAGVGAGLADYGAKLSSYMAADPYKAGGEFATDSKTINAGRANADSAALKSELDLSGRRSGENTSSFAPNLVAAQRQSTLDTADAQAKSDAERLGNETKYQQFGVGASTFPVTANQGMYNSAMGTSEQAAKSPGFWDWFMQNAQQGAKTGADIAAA